jgi:DNA polymerase-4
MDCFYAAVEIKHQPELRGKPVAVGYPPPTRGVLLTASYEARKFKVRSAMPTSQALRLCPELILVPPHFERYKAESLAVREIFARFTAHIEPLSLDEAYLDVTDCPQFLGSATHIAQEIRRLIFAETQLTASAGIAPNKFLAKIASDWRKPNGQFVIKPNEISNFMQELPVEKIHGVGQVTAKKLHKFGLRTCGDIQRQSLLQLARWFGNWGQELHGLAFGRDDRPVNADRERKSLSVEETFNSDIATLKECLERLPGLYSDWERRMTKAGDEERIRGSVVKLKFHDFKSTTCEMATRQWPSLKDFEILLTKAWERRLVPVRLIGIGVRLESKNQTSDQLSFSLE